MSLSVIVAASENGVIGRAGELPWRLPDDLRRFKALTTGHAVIMGRKTFTSVGRALPGRRNLVITRQQGLELPGAETCASLQEALDAVADDPEPFVIGGEAIYRSALPLADRLYLTVVHAELEGDARLPEIDWDPWKLVEENHHPADSRHSHAFSFRTFERRA